MILSRINRKYNVRRKSHWYKPTSLVKNIKQIAKNIALGGKFSFYENIAKKTQEKWCDGIICGHLHKPENSYKNNIHYLNSGDWIESLTALTETTDHQRNIIKYTKTK